MLFYPFLLLLVGFPQAPLPYLHPIPNKILSLKKDDETGVKLEILDEHHDQRQVCKVHHVHLDQQYPVRPFHQPKYCHRHEAYFSDQFFLLLDLINHHFFGCVQLLIAQRHL